MIAHDTDRDFYMNGEEAKAYGIIDEILTEDKRSPEPSRSSKDDF